MMDLIARLEAEEVGPDLDALICVYFQYGGPNSDGATNVRTDGDWDGELLFEQGYDECCNPIPAVTTSLDAALALAERVGWRLYSLDASIIGRTSTMLQSVDDKPGTDPETGAVLIGKAFSCGKTPALALCIAILRAKLAEEPTKG